MVTLPFVVIAYLVLYVLARSLPRRENGQIPLINSLHEETTRLGPQLSLDAWIDWEENIALQKLLDNVAPGGANTRSAAPGTVIASPSRSYPDYYFQCKK
jgi:glucoamylase